MTDPGQPGASLGMTDFFALEANEYLERLDALLQPPPGSAPVAEEFVRLARALRGSALMARQQPIARAASGLEALARTVREGTRTWDAETRQIAIRAVDDLKILARRASNWTEADTAKAEALGVQLGQVAGRPSVLIRAAEAAGLDAGARAFVAREGAATASALDRAAQAVRTGTRPRETLQQVLRAIQPLRGLAALQDVPPLADLLEAIERSVTELAAPPATPLPEAADLLQSAAAAITRAARDVAERGKPDPDGHEFQQFAGVLLAQAQRAPAVVAISSLYYEDAGPHVIQEGAPAKRPSTLARLEVVSHGEHLRQAADALERAPGSAALRLRAYALVGNLRALGDAGAGPLGEALARFADGARSAVTTGLAFEAPQALAATLRRAGDLLTRAPDEDEAALATQLDQAATTLRSHLRSPAPVVATGAAPLSTPPAGVAAIPTPSRSARPLAAATGATPTAAGDEPADFIGSWATYERLLGGGIGPASLAELLGGTAAPVRPSGPTARPSAPRAPASAAPAPEPEVVDIRALLYRGERAAQRADELRQAAQRVPDELLRAILDEVCDLVALAHEPGHPA